jgi:RNA polymerase sporulation-specific sigma factor
MTDRLVRILARKFATAQIHEEDLYQEGMLALIKAEMTYKKESGVKLETYASRVITNRFIDLLRKSGDSRCEFSQSLNEDTQSGDFSLDDEVNLLEIKKILHEQVNDIERAVFNSYVEGFSYEEMGVIFELPRKKIDNIVQKVKRKIKENI